MSSRCADVSAPGCLDRALLFQIRHTVFAGELHIRARDHVPSSQTVPIRCCPRTEVSPVSRPSIDDVVLGNLTGLIKPAIQATKFERQVFEQELCVYFVFVNTY